MKSTKQQRALYLPKVLELSKNGMDISAITALFPVSMSTIYRWISTFAEENPHDPVLMKDSKVITYETEQSSEMNVQALQTRIKELEERLSMAEIKSEAYDEMIKIAEAKFNIPIRKKAGAKQ